ncbi:hypothetical protein OHJ21_19275 [Virgibacillus sp. LDC1]|nr:hypothetical protein [Virgibacillus sp. LDC1]
MNPIKADMFEQLMKVFSKSTQLRNQAPHSSPIREQCNEVMDGIIKLNKVINRIKPENYVKRGKPFIDLIKSIDKSLNGDEALKSHYYKQPDVSVQTVTSENELKKETEIKTKEPEKPKRGGARTGAGRKSIGVKKPVSITLPQEDWNEIDNLIKAGEFKSYADYFRSLREGAKT